MAVAIAAHRGLDVHVVHDERAAAFTALGLGSVAPGVPALLLCTSGTAAVNFHPAVVEASLSAIPMIVLTADRPEEMRGVGAPQTIDQLNLFGGAVAWFHDAGVPDAATSHEWRTLARAVVAHARDAPVHINLAFREPLLGEVGELPPDGGDRDGSFDAGGDVRSAPQPSALDVDVDVDVQRGLIMAGGRSGLEPGQIEALVDHTRWPLLADPLSGARRLDGAITMGDSILRHEGFAAAHAPEVVLRIGRPPASRVVSEWLVRSRCRIVQVGGPGVIDPERLVVARATPEQVLAAEFTRSRSTPWAARWRRAEQLAVDAVETVFAAQEQLTEPLVARIVAEEINGGDLVVASSMPIRDLEWFGGSHAQAFANRGANGIDGTISTALGRALCGLGVTVLLGDLAFLHDASAMIALADRQVRLRIVVIDNNGGGIFSFLPQASALDPERFEQLFGTPHGSDLAAVARAHRLEVHTASTQPELRRILRDTDPTSMAPTESAVSVIVIATDRAANVEHHRLLNDVVLAALDDRPS